ncbi:MAG: VOC family protein [Promethearchaeota archaeon]
MSEEDKIDLNVYKIDQLGFVFKDVEKQAKIFEDLFNIPKFHFIPPFPNTVIYRGKEVNVTTKLGFSRYFNNIQIELIQHIEGESIYKEFIDQGREGLHHISLFVDNLDFYLNLFQKLGFEIIYSGQISTQNWAYLDTEEKLGFLIELQETISRRKRKK